MLPGLAFKGVVIGGGYATGRELAEFFLGSGPQGGLLAILLCMLLWSLVCAVTFALAVQTRAFDYRSFFRHLLGPFWPVFEFLYVLLIILVLAVISAAAGAIGAAMFGWSVWPGTLALLGIVLAVCSVGTAGAERVFKITSMILYLVYAIFVVAAVASFGDRIGERMAQPAPIDGWFTGALMYTGYNVVAAVVILPFLRHIRSRRDALIAGAVSGPLAMLPALAFFLAMVAFYPEIGQAELPSDFLLRRIGSDSLHYLFQLMIFIALVETGVGVLNALSERVAPVWQRRFSTAFPWPMRLALGLSIIIGSAFIATAFGLVELIARGYGALGYLMLAVFVIPLLTIGVWKLLRPSA